MAAHLMAGAMMVALMGAGTASVGHLVNGTMTVALTGVGVVMVAHLVAGTVVEALLVVKCAVLKNMMRVVGNINIKLKCLDGEMLMVLE